MLLVADAMRIRPGCRDEEVQRLHAGIARTLGHDIEQFPIGLCMQFVEHNTVNVESVLAIGLRRQYLVEGIGRQIHDALGRSQNLYPLVECRTHTNHVCRDIKDDAGLLPIRCTAIHFGPLLSIPAGHEQCDCSRQLALALFLWDFHVCCIELPIAIGLQDAEQIPDDTLLPVDQLERFSGPGAFRMAQALDEIDCIIGSFFIIGRVRLHEPGRLVVFQFPQI
jgi:hypothetical protein